jgi:N-acetylglucosamine-6-phosphate deacetylase
MIITNIKKIILPDQEINNGHIILDGKLIEDILESGTDESGENRKVFDASGLTAIPGLIDLHIHGAKGISVTDKEPDSLQRLSRALPEFGITGFLWTTMAVPMPEMDSVMEKVAGFSNTDGAICHGINIEGSFISQQRPGSHLTSCIFEPKIDIVERWLKLSNNRIRLITIAPEKTSDEFIKYLVSKNIITSIGHSHADYEQTLKALESGASFFTHLGNATGMLHQREPGLVGAALLDAASTIEVICDGVHLHSAIVQIFIKVKGWDKVVIVSDGTCVMGMPPGEYKWYDATATFDGESLKLENETIAGGVLPLNKALKNLLKFTKCTLSAAVRMTSLKPARILGIDEEYGSLAPGKIANIVLVDKDYNVVHTFVEGKLVYSR